MKKKSLQEQIERIHTISYGKKVIKEGFLDDLFGSKDKKKEVGTKLDDPNKADLVGTDVDDFYNTFQTAIENGGLKQQEHGSMGYQKEVESMQIGLMILGFDLPKHGIDGLFGPETASAVNSFKEKYGKLNEASEEIRSTLNSLGYGEKGNELTSGGEVTDNISSIVSQILRDFKQIQPNTKITVTSGNDNFHKGLGYQSKHTAGDAVDLVLNPYNNETASAFLDLLNKYKSQNNKFGYIDEYKNPSGSATAGHFHLQYGESTGGGTTSQTKMMFASPEMLTKMLELLKEKNITSEMLKPYLDKVTTGGGAQFTDLDLTKPEDVSKYSTICQKFIDSRPPNLLGVTGNMMSNGAVEAFKNYGKFVPAELALAQLATEGGISNNDPNSRPIRTKNPFNVGNVDSGANVTHMDVQSGINAYYNLIAKNYLGKGKTANDLVNNFVNHEGERYASGREYEAQINQLAAQANKYSQSLSQTAE